jgi:23S rRNA pseudouridine1911/1915/1917 synthase
MDTSGLLVVAKTDPAHRELARQFAQREVAKTYLALVHGAMRPESGTVDRDLGRHPVKRKKQAVLRSGGRPAVTEYRTVEKFLVPGSGFRVERTRNQEPGTRNQFSCLELHPRTGRTHQLRVHLASSGCPILCDGLYGRELEFPEGRAVIRRQALHAARLEFRHPADGRTMSFESPLPADFRSALERLRRPDAPEEG